jgi:protein TonB
MDKNSTYFYVSGLISLSLFAFFLFLFIYIIFNNSDIKTFALKKDNYISISLEVQNVEKKVKKKIIKSSSVESISNEKAQNIDVNDLFSDVWTKKIEHKKPKPKNSKRLQEIQKKINKTKQNSVESISKSLKELESVKTNQDHDSASSANEVNEYLAKIQALVYKHFYVPPNSQGNSVKTVIELNPLGKLIDFRVLQYSTNEALNEEVDKIKDRLKSVVFPINPQNKSSKTIVILISKE